MKFKLTWIIKMFYLWTANIDSALCLRKGFFARWRLFALWFVSMNQFLWLRELLSSNRREFLTYELCTLRGSCKMPSEFTWNLEGKWVEAMCVRSKIRVKFWGRSDEVANTVGVEFLSHFSYLVSTNLWPNFPVTNLETFNQFKTWNFFDLSSKLCNKFLTNYHIY